MRHHAFPVPHLFVTVSEAVVQVFFRGRRENMLGLFRGRRNHFEAFCVDFIGHAHFEHIDAYNIRYIYMVEKNDLRRPSGGGYLTAFSIIRLTYFLNYTLALTQ